MSVDAQDSKMTLFRKHDCTSRLMGDNSFIEKLERLAGQKLRYKKTGPKRKK
jgi:hypothetical protein